MHEPISLSQASFRAKDSPERLQLHDLVADIWALTAMVGTCRYLSSRMWSGKTRGDSSTTSTNPDSTGQAQVLSVPTRDRARPG